jgi:hypothetical protein
MKSRVNPGKNPDLAAYRVDGSARTADTATTAKVGMIYRAETGTAALIGVECMVIEANTNDFTIASKIAPAASDTFYLLRKATPRVGSDGAFAISTTGLASETTLDAIKTSVQLLDNAVSGNELQVDVVSSALPTGASTEATLLSLLGYRFAANASNTTVPYSASSAQALASTAGRKGARFFNNTDGDAYLKLGATASTSDFIIKLSAGGYYNLEQPVYTGRIDVIFANGTAGNLLITELT